MRFSSEILERFHYWAYSCFCSSNLMLLLSCFSAKTWPCFRETMSWICHGDHQVGPIVVSAPPISSTRHVSAESMHLVRWNSRTLFFLNLLEPRSLVAWGWYTMSSSTFQIIVLSSVLWHCSLADPACPNALAIYNPNIRTACFNGSKALIPCSINVSSFLVLSMFPPSNLYSSKRHFTESTLSMVHPSNFNFEGSIRDPVSASNAAFLG